MNLKLSIGLRKLAVIMVVWFFIGFVISVYDYLGLNAIISSGPAEAYTFKKDLIFNLLASVMGSTMGGTFLIFYVNEKLKDKPYGYTLLAVALSFVVLVIFITIALGMVIVKGETNYWPFTNELATHQFSLYLTSSGHLKNIVVWSIVTMMTQLFLQINDKFGPGLLWHFIRGKYHSPQEETRVFMFLDIIGSTTIAEKLGNKNYYNLLRDFYADITNSIIYNGGHIYQYVGDEIVVSWKYENALINHQCIKCFFDARQAIADVQEKYNSKYGLVPDFKAAIHYGLVVAGEIGIIKRDITYSGDVLNTTSRILSKCNQYQEKLLISGNTYQILNKLKGSFYFSKMGEESLRGKAEKMEIYAVSKSAN